MNKSFENLVWIDLEMTGLDVENDFIIEISTIITNKHLSVIAEGPDLVIHQPQEVMDSMGQWCVNQHGKSGLTEKVLTSKVTLQEAEDATLEFLYQNVSQGKAPLCGNSVGHDKVFLSKYMPKVANYLHYRIIDVSSFKEVLIRWYPDNFLEYPKQNTHRALDDIKESINELKHYNNYYFKEPDDVQL